MVDEALAKAWGKLTGHKIRLVQHEWEDEINPLPYWMDDGEAHRVPDPATQPWEWVKAFSTANLGINITNNVGIVLGVETGFKIILGHGDTPEAALEAAIRTWGGTDGTE